MWSWQQQQQPAAEQQQPEGAPAKEASDGLGGEEGAQQQSYYVEGGAAAEVVEGVLRWTLLNLLLACLAALLFLTSWIPGVDWFFLDFFNGSPEQGFQVGVVSGDLIFTTIDSLGWNGAAFTWTDRDEADVACTGPLITSDVCMGLWHKIRANEIYDLLIVLSLAALLPIIAFNSWLVHQLRFGLVEQTQDKATVGFYGCVTSTSAWWLDPCTYVFLAAIPFVPGVLVGLPAFPIAISLARDKFLGLSGLWWGGAQTIFGAQAVVHLFAGYELFAIGLILLLLLALGTVQQRDAYRALVYGGGVDSSEDATKLVEMVTEGVTNRVRSMTGVLNYVPNLQWGAPASPPEGGAAAGAAPGGGAAQQQQQQQQQGNREYSKSTLDQMIPTEEEFGVSPFEDSSSMQGTGKQGGTGALPGAAQQQQQQQEIDSVSAFAPTKSFSV